MSLRPGERARNWRKEWKCSVSGKLASQRPKLTIRDKADLEKLWLLPLGRNTKYWGRYQICWASGKMSKKCDYRIETDPILQIRKSFFVIEHMSNLCKYSKSFFFDNADTQVHLNIKINCNINLRSHKKWEKPLTCKTLKKVEDFLYISCKNYVVTCQLRWSPIVEQVARTWPSHLP